jgi:CBS domain-containing protein
MKVQDVMSRPAYSCAPDADLSYAARIMKEHACGTLPVVDRAGHLAGMITDRDICMALAVSARSAHKIQVREAMTPRAQACAPADDLHKALETMKARRVSRLPVLEDEGRLVGLLSIDDVVLYTEGELTLPAGQILEALREIIGGRKPKEELLAAE